MQAAHRITISIYTIVKKSNNKILEQAKHNAKSHLHSTHLVSEHSKTKNRHGLIVSRLTHRFESLKKNYLPTQRMKNLVSRQI